MEVRLSRDTRSLWSHAHVLPSTALSFLGKMLPGRVFQHTVGLRDDRISVSVFISSTVSLLLCVCLCYLDQILEFGIQLGS